MRKFQRLWREICKQNKIAKKNVNLQESRMQFWSQWRIAMLISGQSLRTPKNRALKEKQRSGGGIGPEIW